MVLYRNYNLIKRDNRWTRKLRNVMFNLLFGGNGLERCGSGQIFNEKLNRALYITNLDPN